MGGREGERKKRGKDVFFEHATQVTLANVELLGQACTKCESPSRGQSLGALFRAFFSRVIQRDRRDDRNSAYLKPLLSVQNVSKEIDDYHFLRRFVSDYETRSREACETSIIAPSGSLQRWKYS